MYRSELEIGGEAMVLVATSSALIYGGTIVGEVGELAMIVPVDSAPEERSEIVRVKIVEMHVVVEYPETATF